MSGLPSGGSTVKNVILGVLTTVVAYVIVHYIFDKKDKKKEFEKVKTETVEAWKSLIKYEDQQTNNYYSALCNDDIPSQLETLIYEKDLLAKNYSIIMQKPGIDEDLASFATRAVENTIQIKKILESYLNEYKNINPYEPGLEQAYLNLDSIYSRKITGARERDAESLNNTYASLVKKYGDEFKGPDEPAPLSENDLVGKWKETGINKVFTLKADGKFEMALEGNDYPGTWKFVNTIIDLSFDDGSGSIKMHITRQHPKYFLFTLNNESTERQCCKQ